MTNEEMGALMLMLHRAELIIFVIDGQRVGVDPKLLREFLTGKAEVVSHE